MSPVAVRRVVLAICVAGIAGMIVSSIVGSTGAAVTFGLITAVAVLCSIVATAVTRPAGSVVATDDLEALGAAVENRVQALVAGGADESDLRTLVADAVRLGRAR